MTNKTEGEQKVEKVLEDLSKAKRRGSYSNWPLREVPFEVIWNEFSRSGIILQVPERG